MLGPGDVPAITSLEEARQSLDMTLFSGIVHGREMVAVQIGLVLRRALDEAPDDVGIHYWDAFLASLSEPVRKELDMLLPTFQPRSDWSKEIFAKGEAKGLAEGEAKGRVKDILVLLAIRGIALTPKLRRRLHECTDLDRLDRWFRNAATAESIEAVFSVEGSPPSSSSKAVRRPAASRSRVRERPRA